MNAAAFVFVSRLKHFHSVPKGSYFLTYGNTSAARFIQLTLQLPVCCWYGQSKLLGSHGIMVSQYGINRELDLSLYLSCRRSHSVRDMVTDPHHPPVLATPANA